MIKKENKKSIRRHKGSYTQYKRDGVIRANTSCNRGYEKYTETTGWTCTEKPKKIFRPEIHLKTKKYGDNRGFAPVQFKLQNKLNKKLNRIRKVNAIK